MVLLPTQKNPCHTFGDFSNLTSSYVKLTVTFIDVATGNLCQDVDSVFVLSFINPCVYGDLNISASGNILTANQNYSVSVCSNVYPNSFLGQLVIPLNLSARANLWNLYMYCYN